MTLCQKCQTSPKPAHSFEKLGTLLDGKTAVFYTAARYDADDSPEAIQYYLQHFQETRPNPWIWIYDCKGMVSKDLVQSSSGKQMAEIVQRDYGDTLLGVYIVNPNWAIKALVQFLLPFMKKEIRQRVHMCSLGILDTVQKLEKAGVQQQQILTLSKRIA